MEGVIPNGGEAANVPAELRALRQWVVWKLVVRGDQKPTKVPHNPVTGSLASSTNPATWGTFDDCMAALGRGGLDGLGFVFTADDPYCGIDLDDVIDTTTGEIDADAAATVERFASYTELSPSRTGVHIIVRGKPPACRKRGDRECYDRDRYFTFTGVLASPHGIEDRQDVLAAWHRETFPVQTGDRPQASGPREPLDISDTDLVEKILRSKQGPKFRALWNGDTGAYPSGSEADLALCSILAGWCQKDAARVDRMFRSSNLMRPKWDAKRGEHTYGARTVAKAVAGANWEYDPNWKGDSPQVVFGAHAEPDATEADADDVAGIDDLKSAGAEVRWLWEGWIQQGVITAVAAEGGTGKTRMTADLVRRIRHQADWPDGKPPSVEPGKTVALWVVADNHHDEMVTLCESFGIADCVKVNAPKSDPYSGVTLEAPEEFAALEKRVKATKPALVIVDTVGNATDRSMSRQEDAKAFYQPLQLIARRQNVAVLCLTHLNAGGKVLGRRALEKVRTCIRLNAENAKDHTSKRRLEVIKSNSKMPEALGVQMGDTGNEYDTDPPPPPGDEQMANSAPRATPGLDKCKAWLEERIRQQPMRVSDLRNAAEAEGFSSKTLYDAKAAIKLEEVSLQGRKWWRFPVDE